MKKLQLITLFLGVAALQMAAQSYVPVVFSVSDPLTNKNVSGAQVTIKQLGWATKSTGIDGKVSFDNVPVGAINFIVTNDGYQLHEGKENVSAEVKNNTFRIPLTVIPITKDKILVTGEVTDKDGRDIEGAEIEVKAANIIQNGLTDKSGNYSIEISLNTGYTVNNLSIEARKGECKVKQSVDIPRGNVIPKDIKLSCGALNSEIVIIGQIRHELEDERLAIHTYNRAYDSLRNVSVYCNNKVNFSTNYAKIIPSEKYDLKDNRGSSLIFSMRKSLWDSINYLLPISFIVELEYFNNNIDRLPPVILTSNGSKALGSSAIKLDQPLILRHPERLTLRVTNQYINEKLSGIQYYYVFDTLNSKSNELINYSYKEKILTANNQDSSFIRAINILKKRTKKPFYFLSNSEIDDLVELYLFSKHYLDLNSFYNQEAELLKANIDSVESRIKLIRTDSLIADLAYSKEVYYSYLYFYKTLNSYKNQIKDILFDNKENILNGQSEFLVFREDAQITINNSNDSLYGSSFGAFIVPARFRFSRGTRYVPDLTIGASFHHTIIRKFKTDVIFGIGLSSVSIVTNSGGVEIESKSPAFTQIVGISVKPSRTNFQFGTFLGFDFVNGNPGKTWSDQGKIWLALGVSYRLNNQNKILRINKTMG